MPRFLIPLVFVSLLPSLAAADDVERPLRPLGRAESLTYVSQHYIVQAEHVLRPEEQAELAAEGVEVQHVLPGNRYVVRTANRDSLDADPRVQSVAALTPSKKLHPTAYADAARGRAFTRLRLLFHDDVSFEEAQRAVENVGGFVERPLALDFDVPHGLQARIPSTSLSRLAADDRVLAIYGGPLHPATDNAQAAALSHVTPLYSAPYNLSGNGVAVSLFELAAADTTHQEFGGRLTAHFTGGTSDDATHATHVSGTITASGVDPTAKGMAPAATLHEFSATTDTTVWMSDKQNTLPSLGVVADNNSWGFQLGWQEGVSGAPSGIAWYGAEEYFGGYDGFYSAPYDKMARNGPVIFVHSAGNDASGGYPSLTLPWSPHGHVDDNGDLIKNEIFCYSQNGSGTDCPLPTCTAGVSHCEITKHPNYGPYQTMGVLASTKNVIAVGAVDAFGSIAFFSSRGPTRDGRVKPDIVAKGVSQYSSVPNNLYRRLQGTSMSSPVITGISALLTEQWRKTFSGQNPGPEMLKALLIAGADDLGTPGPDWTYGFGLADAQASVDLILADNNTGRRIRTATASQGQQIETSLTLSSPQNVRVVLGWADPETLLSANELAGKTLVNDLDVKVIDPIGNTILPYVLDPNDPCIASDGTIVCKPATRGVNTVDNTEEVEIANAAAGTYRIVVSGTSIASGSSQPYVLIANALLGTVVICTDPYEPNDTPATAFGNLPTGTTLSARFCTQSDVDYFKFSPTAFGTVTITVTATDTPVKVTQIMNGQSLNPATIAAGTSGSFQATASPGTTDMVRLEPAGTIGANAGYTLTVSYPFVTPLRRRSSHH